MSLFKKNYSKFSDEELMSLLANGGQQAFDELYSRYAKPVLNFFYRLLNNDRDRAEDLLHDLFLKIIERPESFDQSRTFSTWFYTLATNMVRNEYRSKSVRNEHLSEQLQYSDNQIVNDKHTCDYDLFEDKLTLLLNQLDADTRLLFQLRFNEEMSVKQIAAVFDCPEGTIKSRLFHLTKLLSKKLRIYKPELS